VLEEIVFRGLLQELVRDLLSRAMYGPLTVANLLTSLCFTGAHFFHPPLEAALVFFPSLVFGFFKERTDSLVAPVLLHAFYNAGYSGCLQGRSEWRVTAHSVCLNYLHRLVPAS
jgi:membrane protease YdiL (CAAX protease family)